LGVDQEQRDRIKKMEEKNGSLRQNFADKRMLINRSSENIGDVIAQNFGHLAQENIKADYQSCRPEYNTDLIIDSPNGDLSEVGTLQKRISELEAENKNLKYESKKLYSLYESRLTELKWYHNKYGNKSSNTSSIPNNLHSP
jgi:hypothetical protein